MLEVFNSNEEYQKVLGSIGNNLVGGWSFEEQSQTFYDSRTLDLLRHNKIHKHMLYNDIAWYICEFSDRDITRIKKPSIMYFLIEVNGEIYEDGIEDDLKEILDSQGDTRNHKRITKMYYEAMEYIKADLIENPMV